MPDIPDTGIVDIQDSLLALLEAVQAADVQAPDRNPRKSLISQTITSTEQDSSD